MSVPVHEGDIVGGKYRVEGVLGRGGMSVVVAARHVQLGERVAIKFPLPRVLARGDVAARVTREGRAAARIRSEHVARVYDVGTLDTGEPYLVLEHLRGRDLAAVIEAEGPLAVETALEYVLQACEALAEAHALGIVHRDLKPSNLFLTQRADGSPSVKIIDFGIAKTGGAAADADQGLTDSRSTMGSPLYMAPEQMRSARDVDARADIWAIGAILHCLLTGAPPFVAASLPEVYQLIMAGTPQLRGALPGAPAGLEEVILRCLRRDPADRYANVAELAAALAEHAPARARVSSERAGRILAAAKGGEELVVPGVTAEDRGAAERLAATTTGPSDPTAAPREASWIDAIRRAPGAPPAPAARSISRRTVTPIVAVLALAAAAGGAVVWRSAERSTPSAPPSIAQPPAAADRVEASTTRLSLAEPQAAPSLPAPTLPASASARAAAGAVPVKPPRGPAPTSSATTPPRAPRGPLDDPD